MQPASEPVRPKSVVCIGAFCIDMVCAVQEPVQTGQAVCCSHFSRTLGGKGLNQTVALRQGGLNPHFYAKAGWAEYGLLCSFLKNRGIAADGIYPIAGESNTGILQITPSGDTAILGCANPETAFSEQEVCSILGRYAPGDWLFLQNEISGIERTVQAAKKRGLNVALNPSPINGAYEPVDLSQIDCLILNEAEAFQLTGVHENHALVHLADKTQGLVVITLGERGAICSKDHVCYSIPACPASCKNTLGAGDTFFGFFLAEYLRSGIITRALALASASAALVVERDGTAEVIPTIHEVKERMCKWFC